jgi:hypothetical protein
MAASQPPQCQPAPLQEAVSAKRFLRILRAAWLKSAGCRQQRSQEQLVGADQTAGHLRSQAHALALPLAASSAREISARNSARGASRAQARATITASTPSAVWGPSDRYASRNRLLARLRRTEPRICLLTAKPARPCPWRGTQRSTKPRRSSLRPAWNTAWISLACLRRALRGSPSLPTARLTAPSLDGEPLASLRAPPLEDLSTTLSFHTLPETMRLLPAARVWLIRSLHGGTPSVDRRTCIVY